MATQTLTTTFQADEFKALLADCVALTVKQELAKLTTQVHAQKQILTRQETAKFLNISLGTLHTYTQEGVIKAHRLGYKIRYLLTDIQAALTVINTGRGSNA